MKCENCSVTIGAEFSHAINNNQCPACGKAIMQQARLASYLSLRTLLDNNIAQKGVDIDRLASLIVANFDLKQLFKEDKISSEVPVVVREEEVVEKEEDPDAEFKEAQMKKSKDILQKMREEALMGAVNDRYGFDDGGVLINDDDASMHEIVNKEVQMQKHDMIVNGIGGAFRRE